jgi:glycosyltransferase involved in cell wall biosynthesis
MRTSTAATAAILAPEAAASGSPVDIGIATWGTDAYLGAAVESVLGQTHRDWRLRVSHDGPDDEGVEAALEPYLDDPRIAYSARERRLGAAGNKTWLINQGTAPFVALLDHDDVWDPDFLARRVSFLCAHEGCGFAFASMRIVDARGDELKRWRVRLEPGVQERDEFVHLLLGQNMIGASSAVVRRAAYAAVGPRFDERFPRTYDYEMWLRLTLAAPVGFLEGFDAAWRAHPQQGTGDLEGLEVEYEALVDHAWALIQEQAPDVKLRPRARRRKLASLLLTGVLNAIERDDTEAARRYLGRAVRIDPLSALDPRAPFAACAVTLGATGRSAVFRARAFAHNHGIRLRL